MLTISPVIFNKCRPQISFKGNKNPVFKPQADSFKMSGNLQVLPKDLYFIRMEEYCSNEEWAREMLNATYILSYMIRNNENFEDIWKKARTSITAINSDDRYGAIRSCPSSFFIDYDGRGSEYRKKYIRKILSSGGTYSPKSNSEYKKAPVCSIEGTALINIEYGMRGFLDYDKFKALVKKEYMKLKSNPNPSDKDINRSVAIIHWLIAQACPFVRGSDSFANLLTKSIYHSHGMKLSPAKEGVSFDFEAFYTDLNNYIKRYPDFFEKPPSRK